MRDRGYDSLLNMAYRRQARRHSGSLTPRAPVLDTDQRLSALRLLRIAPSSVLRVIS